MVITEKRKIGNIGEDLACKFLRKEGLKIVERNYLKSGVKLILWLKIIKPNVCILWKSKLFPVKDQRGNYR